MDAAEAALVAARVSLVNPAIPTSIEVVDSLGEGDDQALRLVVHLSVPDRDTGDPVVTHHSTDAPKSAFSVGFVVAAVRKAWRHELDEALHLDGERVNDPHQAASPNHDFTTTSLERESRQ